MARKRRWSYMTLRLAHICVRCERTRVRDTAICKTCRDKDNARRKSVKGCERCKNPMSITTVCDECKVKRRENELIENQQRFNAGICRNCENRRERGRQQCTQCLEAKRLKAKL